VDIKLLGMVSGVAVKCLKANGEERLDMKQVKQHLLQIIGGYAQHGQQSSYQGNQSPIPDDVDLLMQLQIKSSIMYVGPSLPNDLRCHVNHLYLF
jgi:hypothetical protein